MRWKTTEITKIETFNKFFTHTIYCFSGGKILPFYPFFSSFCCSIYIIVKLLHISTLLTLGFWRNKEIEIIIFSWHIILKSFLFRFNSWWIWKIITHKKEHEDEKFYFFYIFFYFFSVLFFLFLFLAFVGCATNTIFDHIDN